MSKSPKALFIIKISGAVLLLLVVLFCGVAWYTRHFVYDKNTAAIPSADAIMVLGAGILKSGEPSPILRERISEAVTLYEAGKAPKILVTGNSVDPHVYDETTAMEFALRKAGVPKKDIILDPLGVDTYSSMYRARDVYHLNSLLVATQVFHLPRALFIAHALGVQAYGVSADTSFPYMRNYLRELFALPKAVAYILVHKKA